jgi:hypothetical protein
MTGVKMGTGAKVTPPADPCRNPACEYHDQCGLRGVPAAMPALSSPKESDSGAEVGEDNSALRGHSFEVRQEPCGAIGALVVQGAINDSLLPVIRQGEPALHGLAGLFVVFDTLGGSVAVSDRLEAFVHKMMKQIPVVSFILRGLSGAVLPAAATDLCIMDIAGIVGGFGVCQYFCDGDTPRFIVSHQSPRKCGGGRPPWAPPRFATLTASDRDEMQVHVNRQFERDIAAVARYRRVAVAHLRPFLDGRNLLSWEAREAALIDEVLCEEEAYKRLLGLVDARRHITPPA